MSEIEELFQGIINSIWSAPDGVRYFIFRIDFTPAGPYVYLWNAILSSSPDPSQVKPISLIELQQSYSYLSRF